MPTDFQNIPINSDDSYTPSPLSNMTIDSANFVAQIDPSKVVEELYHNLSGEVYDYKNKAWIKGANYYLNERGVNIITTRVRAIVNQNTTMSNLDEETIRKIMVSIGDELAILLFLKYEEFEVDKAKLTSIVSMVQEMIYCSLMRAWLEGERDMFKDTIRSAEQSVVRMNEESGLNKAKSFLGSMFNK
jgi:hypothetical protein